MILRYGFLDFALKLWNELDPQFRTLPTIRIGVNYIEKVINYIQLYWKLFN